MEKCFVIQPFDNDKFDKRFTDVFHPAIAKAGLDPYRIDGDLSVRVPIDEIEKNILESPICFAEITTDNPNVWYELGFAFACKKDVVIVCSDERQGKFPFDIQHRHIITYKTSSKSDFENLEATITKKIKALLQSTKTADSLNSTPVVDTEGLKSNEIAMLILIMENQFVEEDSMSISYLKTAMTKSGYTDIATSVSLQSLARKKMVETFKFSESDWNGNVQEYHTCRLTTLGTNWILENQDQLIFRKDSPKDEVSSDELPF